MRKISISLIIFFITTASFNAFSQEQNSEDATIKTPERKGRPDVPGTFLIELGWSLLQDAPSSMDTKIFGSRTLNLLYFYDIQIGNSNFAILPGFGVGLDRYKFDNDVTLVEAVDNNGNTMANVDTVSNIVGITDVDVKKSMLITNYFDIPLEFRFYANPGDKKRSFKAGVGVKGGIRFSSHTKLKYDDNGDNVKVKNKRNYELNRWRYGVTGRIGVGGFNVYYYQSFSELFDGNGPEGTDATTNITIGLSFTGF